MLVLSSLWFTLLFAISFLREDASAFMVTRTGMIRSEVTKSVVTNGLSMAGFGKSDAKGKKSKKSSPIKKLKPKAQWDRYCQFKASKAVEVAVRVVGKDDWIMVGKVKSENDQYTPQAVVLQRAIIADHSKRLFPLQVGAKDALEWAYLDAESEDWVQVDPKDESLLGSVEDKFEKMIGYEGKPDPATGFYCHYENGKLVDKQI